MGSGSALAQQAGRTQTSRVIPVPVLLFHGVGDARDLWTVSPARFAEDVRSVLSSGRAALTLGAYASRLGAGADLTDLVVLSFDDGHSSNLTSAQLLAAAGLPCTVYVSASYVGAPGMLTPAQLRELADTPGVEVGSHADQHIRLDELPRPRIAAELRDSKHRLEDLLQRPIGGIAYPHGSHDHRVLAEARAAGYTSGAGVKDALSHPRDNPMAVARMTVTASTTAPKVQELLAGQGRLAERRPRLRTVGYRALRRANAALRG